MSIIAAIPHEWKLLLKAQVTILPPCISLTEYKKLDECNCTPNTAYNQFICADSPVQISYDKLYKLNISLSYEEWVDILQRIAKMTKLTKYKSYQYLLLHQTITFYNTNIETIQHLFYDCQYVHVFY